MLSCFSHVWLFVTPWTVARQTPLSMGLSRQEYSNGFPCPPPGDIPNLRIKATPFMPPALPGELPYHSFQFSSVQSRPTLCDPMDCACQASLSTTNSQSLLKLMSIESVMPSNQIILCRCLLLLPSIFPSIRVFWNESALRIRWPKYWTDIQIWKRWDSWARAQKLMQHTRSDKI